MRTIRKRYRAEVERNNPKRREEAIDYMLGYIGRMEMICGNVSDNAADEIRRIEKFGKLIGYAC